MYKFHENKNVALFTTMSLFLPQRRVPIGTQKILTKEHINHIFQKLLSLLQATLPEDIVQWNSQ